MLRYSGLRHKTGLRKKGVGMTQHVGSHIRNAIPQEHQWKISLLKEWPTIVGNLKDKVSLHSVGESHLVLTVSHPSLAQELYMLQDMLKHKINSFLQSERITSLQFRTYSATKKKKQNSSTKKRYVEPEKDVTLNVREQKTLHTVKNKELRDALCAFYITCKKRQAS